MKKGDAERERGESECEWTTSDARREAVEEGTGEPTLGEPEGVETDAMDVSANRGGGSSGSSSTTGSGIGSGRSGRISASVGGKSRWSSLMGDSSNGSRAPGIASEESN